MSKMKEKSFVVDLIFFTLKFSWEKYKKFAEICVKGRFEALVIDMTPAHIIQNLSHEISYVNSLFVS